LVLPLVILSAASVCGSLLAPHLLVANPLLLMALSPRNIYLAGAAGSVPLPVFMAVGLLRLGAADPCYYALGRRHGPAIAAGASRRSPLAGRIAGRLLKLGRTKGLAVVALSPTGKVLTLAGASGIRSRHVAVADAGGTLVQLIVLYAAGQTIGQALHPSPRTLTIVAVVVALSALAWPAAVALSTQKRSRARRLDAPVPFVPGTLGP